MAGLDIGDAGKVLDQLKSEIGKNFDKPGAPDPLQWSIWSKPEPGQGQPGAAPSLPRFDATPSLPKFDTPTKPAGPGFDTTPPPLPRFDATPPPTLKPEQMVGTGRADEATKQSVFKLVDQASKTSNRSVAGNQFMQAINISNNSHDATLQAISKVEYGLANLNWGFSEEGFKWILEAGSNNPSLYDSKQNQSFLNRLAQSGMPRTAVDLLMANGSQDPAWYVKDAGATRKLDAAMTGAAFVPPSGDRSQAPRTAVDPLAPPSSRPDSVNTSIQQPGEANGWMRDQINQGLQSASREANHQTAFELYRQATDLSDRSGDNQLRVTARVEAGLALISWGSAESGFKWLLDAGSLNPALYDNTVNQAFQQRLRSGGINESALDMFLKNGQRDPNWHLRSPEAARTLAAILQSGDNPNRCPTEPNRILPVPNPFPVQPGQDRTPPANPVTPHVKPNPFGG
jgi:hypothetical protein